jgi:hypothetical protein
MFIISTQNANTDIFDSLVRFWLSVQCRLQNFGTGPYSPDLAPSVSFWSKKIDLIFQTL